jgi:hypothetical protein
MFRNTLSLRHVASQNNMLQDLERQRLELEIEEKRLENELKREIIREKKLANDKLEQELRG